MTMTRMTTALAPASMLDRIVTIVNAFDGEDCLTLSQVVSRTGLPRSSAHRILEHLVEVNWLRRDELGYHLGLRMMELGTLAGYQHQLRGAASAHLHDLAYDTGLVVHLSVLDGTEIIYLEKIGGRFAQSVPSRVGGRAPVTCTGAGKVLLAYAANDTLHAVLRSPFQLPTSASIGTERRLRSELAQVKGRGIAFDREESARGLGCVAAPVGAPGTPIAAVSICGPVNKVNFERLIAPVRATAHAINTSFREGRTPPPSSLREVAAACPRPQHTIHR